MENIRPTKFVYIERNAPYLLSYYWASGPEVFALYLTV